VAWEVWVAWEADQAGAALRLEEDERPTAVDPRTIQLTSMLRFPIAIENRHAYKII